MGDFASLEDLIIPTESLTFAGRKFRVQGLSFAQIVRLARDFRPIAEELYLKASAGELSADVTEVVQSLLIQCETAVAAVIAHGLGSPDQIEKAAALPVGVQVEVIEKIVRLTISNEGGLEKLIESVVRAVEVAAKLTDPQTSQSG